MAKKASGSNDKKGTDNKKGKAKTEEDGEEKQTKVTGFELVVRSISSIFFKGKSALKAANAVNVRHILCEKHSRSTEALEKIKVSLLQSYYYKS